MFVSTLLLQAAWILAMPAFRGIDEFDHVYKADAVAHGSLRGGDQIPGAHGTLVVASEDIVRAAGPMCASYGYTSVANCRPVAKHGDDLVTVASGAATYNPTYYAVAGIVSLPFDGAAADFAMRAVTALLSALLLGWAATATVSWSRTAWPVLAMALATTPVLVYSTAIASPNGLCFVAGCLFWAAGIGLLEKPRRSHYAAVAVAGMTMMVTHATGLMWFLLSLAVLALMQSASAWRAQLRRDRRRVLLTATAATLPAAACVAWILTAKTNAGAVGGDELRLSDLGVGDLLTSQVLWSLQTVAAFPLRDEPAPAIVYALWLVPFLTVMGMAARRASHRCRNALIALGAAWVLVPLALTIASFSSIGLAWQGRYALPLAVGFPAIAGLVLTRHGIRPSRLMCLGILVTCAVAHVVSIIDVAIQEKPLGLSPTFAESVPGGVAIIAVLAIGGALTLVAPALRGRTPRSAPASLPMTESVHT